MTAVKVVDASALAAAAFLEPAAIKLAPILHGRILAAPTLLRFEMTSICLKKIRARPTERDAILAQYENSLLISVEEHDVNQAEVRQIAETHNLSAYDASYLWLARHLDVELVTLDEDLGKAMQKSRA